MNQWCALASQVISIEYEVGRSDADWAVERVEEERQEWKAGGETQKRVEELAVGNLLH